MAFVPFDRSIAHDLVEIAVQDCYSLEILEGEQVRACIEWKFCSPFRFWDDERSMSGRCASFILKYRMYRIPRKIPVYRNNLILCAYSICERGSTLWLWNLESPTCGILSHTHQVTFYGPLWEMSHSIRLIQAQKVRYNIAQLDNRKESLGDRDAIT